VDVVETSVSKITEPLRASVTFTMIFGSFICCCSALSKEAESAAVQEEKEYEPLRRNTNLDIIKGQVCESIVEQCDG